MFGFTDEILKAAAEGRLIDRFDALKSKYERGISNIFDKQVPGKIEAMLKRRFPKFKPEKQATIEKVADFREIVHSPIVQALGYAALAGEGIHALGHGQKRFPKLRKAMDHPRGKLFGTASLVGGTTFLAAEGLAALIDAFGRKRKKKAGKAVGDIIIQVQAPSPMLPKIRIGKAPRMPLLNLSKMTKSIGFKR